MTTPLVQFSNVLTAGRSARDLIDPEFVIAVFLRNPVRQGVPTFRDPAIQPINPVAGAAVSGEAAFQVSTTVADYNLLVPPPPLPAGNFNLGGVGDIPVSGLHSIRVNAETQPSIALIYWATEDFTTLQTDTVEANRWFDGRLSDAGQVSRSIGLTALDRASVTTEIGSLVLSNADGGLDTLPDLPIFAGSEAVLVIGRRCTDLGGWRIATVGRVEGADVSEFEANLTYVAATYLFDEEYLPQTYAGTGGIEGPVSLKGARKPVLIGRCYNLAPVMIEPLTYIFQIHAGTLGAVTTARHGGVPFTFSADYANFAALQAATLATGFYATCLAQGLVRMGLTAGGTSSFTVTVDAETTLVGAAEISVDLAERATLEFVLTSDVPAFEALEVAFPGYTYGRYITSDVTWSDVLGDVMRSMNAYWGIDRIGRLSAGWFSSPDPNADSVMDLTSSDILSIDRLALPDGFRWPHNERTLRYRKNWSPLTNVAAIVNDPALSTEWRAVGLASDSGLINSITPAAEEVGLQDEASANDLNERLLALHGRARTMFAITIPMALGLPGVLTQVRVTYPRFGLDNGRVFIIVAVTENYQDRTVALTCWG